MKTIDKVDLRHPVDVLGEEFIARRRRGERITVNEFADSHPAMADQIRHTLPAMLALEQLKVGRTSSCFGRRRIDLEFEPLDQLGDYRIVREIGRGGMGVVFEAEQQTLGRRVAVKVFPRQALTDQRHLDRFLQEAKTAASLHHTNIVPVFGVGKQDDFHYYVMQRIEGIPLNQVICASEPALDALAGNRPQFDWEDHAIRRNRSEWHAIADVGIQVASALAYAHAQGVLHRDIKPSNLLLDAQGTVWITDFGLATVIAAEEQELAGEVAGTLRFMAPEHFTGKQDARSDVYSLGLTLYELLTRQPAFRDRSRTSMLTRIITGSVTLPRALRREIPADLQAIVLKAIAKQPEHRYEDAASMAADLRRFCEGRTVAARRVGPLIKMARSARRNPVVATLSVALFTLAICSFALISSKWRDAVAENQRAEDNLSVALESMDQILEKFGSSWMAHPATNELANAPDAGANLEIQFAVSDYSAKVLQDALVFYDRFAVHNPTDPRIRHDTSKVHRRVGDIYQRLGQHDRAETAYRRSLSFFDSQPIDENLELTLEVASTQNQLGLSLFMASRFDDARHEYLRVNQLLAQSPHHRDSRCRTEQARTLTNMANCLSLMFRHREALECQKHAIQIIEGIVSEQAAEDSAGLIALAQAYRSYYRLAGFQRSRDRKASKENLDRIRNSGVKILEQLVQEYPNVPDYRCELAAMLEASRAGQPTRESQQRRIGDLQRAVELARELAADHPMIPRYRAVLARTLNSLARTLRVSQPARAESLFREAITIYRALSREFRDVPVYRTFLVWSMNEQIRHLRAGGRHQDAVSLIQEAIAEQSACLDLRPNHRFNQVRLGHLYRDLANAYKRMDKTVEAELAHEQSQQYLN